MCTRAFRTPSCSQLVQISQLTIIIIFTSQAHIHHQLKLLPKYHWIPNCTQQYSISPFWCLLVDFFNHASIYLRNWSSKGSTTRLYETTLQSLAGHTFHQVMRKMCLGRAIKGGSVHGRLIWRQMLLKHAVKPQTRRCTSGGQVRHGIKHIRAIRSKIQ